MWEKLKLMFRKLFGKQAIDSTDQTMRGDLYVRQYRKKGINFTAIVASVLATITVTESNVDVIDTGEYPQKRTQDVQELIHKVWEKAKKITAQAFGTGGVLVVPYCTDGKVYFDIVTQNRFVYNAMRGDQPTDVCVLADHIHRDRNLYARWTDYELTPEGCFIHNRATKNDEIISLADVPEWADIEPDIFIPGCSELPLVHLKCPTDNRETNDRYGVPVTFGSEDIIEQIEECLVQFRREFKKKDAKIFADRSMFDEQEKLDKDLYVSYAGGSLANTLMDVFDPAFRDSSYGNRLFILFELLEKSMGTSKGILTEQRSEGATATEIKRGSYGTFALVHDMRTNWENVLDKLCYIFGVLCDFYAISPPAVGELTVKCDWSYTLVESSQEAFGQMREGCAMGAISKAEVRQFIKPKETLAEAQAAVDEIAANSPSIQDLIGDA